MAKLVILVILAIVLLAVVIICTMAVYDKIGDSAAKRKLRKLDSALEDIERYKN